MLVGLGLGGSRRVRVSVSIGGRVRVSFLVHLGLVLGVGLELGLGFGLGPVPDLIPILFHLVFQETPYPINSYQIPCTTHYPPTLSPINRHVYVACYKGNLNLTSQLEEIEAVKGGQNICSPFLPQSLLVRVELPREEDKYAWEWFVRTCQCFEGPQRVIIKLTVSIMSSKQ